MKQMFARTAAGVGTLAVLATGSVVGATAAHAAPKVLCTFATTNGASGDVSALKCKNADGTAGAGMATWVMSDEIEHPNGDTIGSRTGQRPQADGSWDDVWAFDPSMVSFTDFKKELMRSWGYLSVTIESAGTGSGDPSFLVANFTEPPSKKKN